MADAHFFRGEFFSKKATGVAQSDSWNEARKSGYVFGADFFMYHNKMVSYKVHINKLEGGKDEAKPEW